MMMKGFILFLTVMMVSTTTFVAGQDPLCLNGLAGTFGVAAACCPTFCGTCGGPGCDARPGGPNNCCGTLIQASGRSCDTHSAPCTIQRDPECITGLANRAEGVCCASACGTCGGVEGQGCERRFDIPIGEPTADRCCSANVRAANRPCATFAPPCTLPATSCTSTFTCPTGSAPNKPCVQSINDCTCSPGLVKERNQCMSGWNCRKKSNVDIIGTVKIWWGHTGGDAAWACNTWVPNCNNDCEALSSWNCQKQSNNGGIVGGPVTIWWGHSAGDAAWACNAWVPGCDNDCRAVRKMD